MIVTRNQQIFLIVVLITINIGLIWLLSEKISTQFSFGKNINATLEINPTTISTLPADSTPINSTFSQSNSLQRSHIPLTTPNYTPNSIPKVPVEDLLSHCNYEFPENPEYNAVLLEQYPEISLNHGQTGLITIHLRNDGNVRWFSDHSGCENKPLFFLGTQRRPDAPSEIGLIDPVYNHLSWLNTYFNRVKMSETFVNPGQTATFHIIVKAPDYSTVVRQYFAPLIENVTWLEETTFSLDLISGNPGESILQKKNFVARSLDFASLPDEKSLDVDLRGQKVHLLYGETIVNSFTVSSGKAATPTPQGNFQIHRIEDLRIAGAKPHYLMPNYLSLTKSGSFGFHALPSLRNDNGVFWTEALNHIGIPVSHGCIRLLPDDSEILKTFVEIGTPVKIHR